MRPKAVIYPGSSGRQGLLPCSRSSCRKLNTLPAWYGFFRTQCNRVVQPYFCSQSL
jgi:hypothetical protein